MDQKFKEVYESLIKEKAFLEKEIESIARITSLISVEEPQIIFKAIVQSAMGLLEAESGSLMVYEKKSDCLVIAAAEGISSEVIKKTKIKAGKGIAGWVFKTREPLILVEGLEDARLMEFKERRAIKDALSVPVIWGDEVLGVLNVSNKQRNTFSEADLVPLMVFANQAAVVLNEYKSWRKVEDSYLSMVAILSESVDTRDPYTLGHSKAVRDYCLGIGRKLGLENETLNQLELAAILHDLGKLTIPDTILGKKSALTAEEYEVIKTHPLMSVRILQPVAYFERVIPIILHHHERYDGSGYPAGLKGESIPLEARIMAIADAFDAMSSKRIYRHLLSTDAILLELRKGRGRQFDPHILDVFLREFEIDRRIYRAGERRLAEVIHEERFDYYFLAIRDNPQDVKRFLALIANTIESLLETLGKYAGLLVKEKANKKLNTYSIEHRLDFIVSEDKLETRLLIPINLVDLMKRFQVYLDHFMAVTTTILGSLVSKSIIRDSLQKWDEETKLLFKKALESTHFWEQAA